jgi:hypothetical protein
MTSSPDHARTIERVRDQVKAILRTLPAEEPDAGLAGVLAEMKSLLPGVPAAPWYLSKPEADDYGSPYLTLAPHEPPHYEEMVAQFYLGNHTDETAKLILLVLNNLEDLIAAAETSLK